MVNKICCIVALIVMVIGSFIVGFLCHSEFCKVSYPEFNDNFKGICIGHCIHGDFPDNELAHAHNNTSDDYYGWLCFKDYASFEKNFLHEYTHLLCPNQGHTWLFYKTLNEINNQPPRILGIPIYTHNLNRLPSHSIYNNAD